MGSILSNIIVNVWGNNNLMIRHRQEAQGWVLRPASADLRKGSCPLIHDERANHSQEVRMSTPLNLVPELLMVLGATTSSKCSICSYAYTHCIDDERFDDMGGHIGAMRC